MPDRSTLQAHYGADYFARHYGGDREAALARCDGLLEEAERRLGARAGHALDVGCGVGDFDIAARQRGWSTVGIESAPEAARRAAERGCSVVRGDAAALLDRPSGQGPPELAGPFDLVVFRDVLGHLSEAGSVLRAAVARLRPGGWLVVRTPNRHAGVFRLARRIGWLREASGILHLPAQVLHLDREALGRILDQLGLVDRSIEGESESVAGSAVRYSASPLADWLWRRCLAAWKRRGEPETLRAWGRHP